MPQPQDERKRTEAGEMGLEGCLTFVLGLIVVAVIFSIFYDAACRIFHH
jgi:hypothetical protein